MPAVQRSEFALALNQVANERGIDPSIVLDTVENAILAAYRKDHPETELEDYTAILDPNSGEAKIMHGEEDVTPPGFGRIAAQTAKQVILQKIREKEKEAVITDYRDRIGTIANGMVLRFAGPNIIVDIGKAEGVMPSSEQISIEKYHLNQRFSVYLKEIHEGPKGEEVLVSRADNGLLEGLLKREVPEVAQGSVEIKAIEREPGNRAKIAVASTQAGIDPVGSCVGQKGVRVQAIIAEFNGLEKIDIIQWQEDSKEYIMQALSPAKDLTVEIDEKEKTAHVKVPQEELSLAIGKDGQNVRLASKLTGYRIEIEGEEGVVDVEEEAKKIEEEEKAKRVARKEENKEESKVEDEVATEASASTEDEVATEASASTADDSKDEVKDPNEADLASAEIAKELDDAEKKSSAKDVPAEVAEEQSEIKPMDADNPDKDKNAKEENS